MKVLLLSTYELGHQPLGLASPLAHLRAAGLDAHGIDLAVEPLDEVAVADAGLIAISVPMHTALRLGVQAAERVRALNPRAKICFYGLYAGLNAAYLQQTGATSVIGGEIEAPLVQLALQLASGQCNQNAQCITQIGRPTFLRPNRDGLPPLESYAHLEMDGRRHLVGCVEASRGCAHQCLHCPITPVYGGRLRIVPQEIVLADVRRLVELGAEHITFADPDFFNGVRHSMAIARAMHAEFPALTFDATIKVEHLIEHQVLLAELRGLGCVFILSAVESLSDTVLRNLDKGHTAGDVRTALALTRSAGISLRPSLLPFTPWTTIDDYLELIEFVEANGLIYHVDPVQFAIRLLVPPGSSLIGTEQMRGVLGALDEADFAHSWCHPDPRMDALAREVTALVEAAVNSGEDNAITLAAIRRATCQMAGVPEEESCCATAVASTSRPPRLSESWFCCAEPTREQLALVVEAPAAIT
jgi:radical SAM superfamily enzyme YgiQ (UPF0313 family)